jgi:transcriptional antiterminator NusG
MIMDDQSWYVVRHTPGVTNFVGVGNRPLPVAPNEIEEILIKIGEKEAPAAPKVEITCEVGDRVRVVSGAFAGSEGPVTEIIPARGKVKFSASIFGHETEIEVDFAELEKL